MLNQRARLALGLGTAVSLALLTGPAGAVTFEKGPYLQALGPAGVTVKVEVDPPAPVTITVTDAAARKELTFTDPEVKGFHGVRVSGLAPSTSYEYVAQSGAAKSEVGRFTTAPVDDRPFRFILYGDSRTDDVSHRAIVAKMLEARADFLVSTGDVVYRGADPKEWARFFDIEGPLLRDRCAFVAVGNHELVGGKDGEVAYLKYFAPDEIDPRADRHLFGSVRWGNTRFFFLNAMDELGGREKDWLAQAASASLTEPGVVHRIAVLHHGPFSSGPHRGNPRIGSVLSTLRDNKIELVLAGHDHIYERGEGAGIKYVISGGAGAPLYPREHQAPETMTFESVHHDVEMSIDKDKVSIAARRAAGSLIEACSYTIGQPWTCEGVSPSILEGPGHPGPPTAGPTKPETSKPRGRCSYGAGAAVDDAVPIVFALLAWAGYRRRRRLAERS